MNGRDHQSWRRSMAGYGLAASTTALAALARWLLPAALTPAPYLGFYPAVVTSAALGGVGPGLVTTFASLLLVNFVFGRFNVHDHGAMARQVIWVVASIGVSLLAGMQRTARIRERRQAEELRRWKDELEVRVQERTAEIQQANGQLRAANEKLAELDHAKTVFFSNVSHELRTPLTLILGPVRKLQAADTLADEHRHDLAVVERNAHLLLKHVNDLLDLSKLDAGRMGIEYARTDLVRLARFVASHFESVADERRIALTVEMPEPLTAEVDPGKLQRVFFNLLSNAFKFTPAGGTVRLRLQSSEGNAVFVVEDTGPGVAPELREAIFERFQQVDSGATRRHGGTGLGLAIVKEFVHLHRGAVAVGETPGGGASFTVTVPRTAPEGTVVKAAGPAIDEEAARSTIAELQTPVGLPTQDDHAVAPGAPLVLVVEDNPEMNAFLAETLAGRYRVARAVDGQEGLDKAVQLLPDLILSDIMMPRMSGEELVRRVRDRRDLDAVPVILLTAKADETLRVQWLREGAQDCLVKPFLAEELLARAAGLIDRKHQAEAAVRESRRLLEEVMDESPSIIFLKDREGRFLTVNRHLEDLLKRSRTDLQGKTDHDLFPPDTADVYRANDRCVLETGRPIQTEETVDLPDGRRRVFLSNKFPLFDAEGRIYGVGGISQDITDRKQAEDELRGLKDELEVRVQRRTAELVQANRELEAFTHTVSHDLRAPLRHVMGFAGLLERQAGPALDDKGREYTATITQAAKRMAALIDGLLTLSRIGRAALTERDVDLRQLVEEVRQELASETAGRVIDWQIGPFPVVRGDPTLLRSVVVNLLGNAIKYTRPRSPARIEVGGHEQVGELVCFVRDNGVGFDMQLVDKLFGVFQRLHPAEAFEGTGVGLASVKRIIERHGGRVWAEGAVDRGATVYFTLPTRKEGS